MNNSKIEWTDTTWNPVRGCSRISPGCVNCYAERLAARFSGPGEPFHEFVRIANGHPQWTGKLELVEKHLLDPLRLGPVVIHEDGCPRPDLTGPRCKLCRSSETRPRRIFVNSMSDLFHEALSFEDVDRIFRQMSDKRHVFQVLTKRPERMLDYALRRAELMKQRRAEECPSLRSAFQDALLNVWLGCSVEDQQRADERLAPMREIAALGWNTFVSYEPAIGPVDWRGWEFLRWLIVGGESGPGARPFDMEWARAAIRQCRASGTACFVKQLGAHPLEHPSGMGNERYREEMDLRNSKGGDISEWPEDLRVREFPR